MKYIKKFNESNSEYYVEIDRDELKKLKSDYFTQSELDKIGEEFVISKKTSDYLKYHGFNPKEVTISIGVRLGSSTLTPFMVTKVQDDYYFVNDILFGKYYKCDQLDGLMWLLHDIKKSHPNYNFEK